MAKSTRFRNRKINFKTRLQVRTGSAISSYDEEDGGDGEVEFEEDKHGNRKGLETGVDKEEEGEVHLQAVLASSSASVTGSRIASGSGHHSNRSGGSLIISTAPRPKAFIPTPDSTGTIDPDLFKRLYPSAVYVDPSSYIKFSDTVEEAQTGAVAYTMDEDDEDWLETFNATFASTAAPVRASSPSASGLAAHAASSPVSTSTLPSTTESSAVGGKSKRKGDKGKGVEEKGKEVAVGPITDDEFEAVMELFERITEQKAPMAHVVRLILSLACTHVGWKTRPDFVRCSEYL